MAAPSTLSGMTAAVGLIARIRDLVPLLEGLSVGKTGNVVFLLLLLLLSKFILDLVVHVTHSLIRSHWAPLNRLFPDDRVSLTLSSVVLSLVRYVIYFILFGKLLFEFGVDTTTYLASASFIAIAVGFGSQGLVQDVVTGFFILFERQLSVGDLAEIQGQTGVIREISLRVTRLETLNGGSVTIPHRSITQVTTYPQGHVPAHLEIEGADTAKNEALTGALRRLGERFEDEYPRIIRGSFRVRAENRKKRSSLIRVTVPIWPGQTWVVEDRLTSAVKKLLEKLEIPHDQVQTGVFSGALETDAEYYRQLLRPRSD